MITSKDNARVKAARRVRDGRDRSLVFIEGLRLANEALRSGLLLRECFVSEQFISADEGVAFQKKVSAEGVAVNICSEPVFRSLADTMNPQGVVLISEAPGERPCEYIFRLAGPLLLLYCFEVNDPTNLGALLRTAEAAGASGVILSPNSTWPFAPKVLRASMGAAFRVAIATGVAFEEFATIAATNDVGTAAAAAGEGTSLYDLNFRAAMAVVLGSEANGLPAKIAAACDSRVQIPMKAGVESLNLAVSGGIILYEAVRQRMA
ncbi:MAG: RNA methyltransferase [Acidobacteria bacterium]|nr:RNA methyltransferase [Acidobacteriota bacterium]